MFLKRVLFSSVKNHPSAEGAENFFWGGFGTLGPPPPTRGGGGWLDPPIGGGVKIPMRGTNNENKVENPIIICTNTKNFTA